MLLPFADLFVEDQEWITDAVKRNAAIENAKYRNWTDSTGKYKTEAEFGGMVGQKVTFIKRDGSKVQVPLEKLSDEDREWIAKRKK